MESYYNKIKIWPGIHRDMRIIGFSTANTTRNVIYLKILTTSAKKNYGGLLLAELGKFIKCDVDGIDPENEPDKYAAALDELENKKKLDIKGLGIRKSTVPRGIREDFTKILKDDILKPNELNLPNIIKKYDDIIDKVESSLRSGSIEFLIPGQVKLLDQYSDPYKLMSVRGMVVWNALEPDSQIVPPDKVKILKLKTGIELKRNKVTHYYDKNTGIIVEEPIEGVEYSKIKEDETDAEMYRRLETMINNCEEFVWLRANHPEKFDKVIKTVYGKDGFPDKGFAVIALPADAETIPDYLLPLVDYNAMVVTNTSAGNVLLDSLGIYCNSVDGLNYKTNIFKA